METINPRFEASMAFLSVVEYGSFTAAAEAAGHTKAHLSKQVSRLEASLGVQLMHRTTRRITLTEAGKTYADYCRRLKTTLDEATRTVSGLKQEAAGKVRLTAPITFGSMFMCDLLMAFHEAYPKVDIELDLSRRQRDLIAEGFDLAIRSSRTLDERLVAKPLSISEEWLVASPEFLARHGEPMTPQELAGKPCILNGHFKEEEGWLFLRDGQQVSVEVDSWLSINDYPLIRRAALAGAGFAKLPHYVVEPDLANGSLVRVLSDYTLPHFPLFLVFPQGTAQLPKIRALIDFVERWFKRRG